MTTSKPPTQRPDAEPEDERSLGNRPVDPNSVHPKVKVPPGVDSEEVWDPGSQSPDAPPVDNRS